MCDTIAITGADRVLFAKNSDRDPNEGQALEWHPAQTHAPGTKVRCTWIEIPQVRETRAVLLSRPFWMWGAEMGANDCGVVIGNEAVFTREPYARTGLTGMDLLRLALERAATAREACGVITTLLETRGQGGGCGHENRRFTYHNSFIVADPRKAFVLETAGKHWAVAPIEGARSISNGLTIPGFAREHGARVKTFVSACRVRRRRTQQLAEQARTTHDLFGILRDHGEGAAHPRYSWLRGGMAAPCMHAGGLVAASQTTASWVAELTPAGCLHWVTATSTPDLSLFKPVTVEQPVDFGPAPGERVDDSLWWKHERLARLVLRDPARLAPAIEAERDAIEQAWLAAPPPPDEAFAAHHALIESWLGRLRGVPVRDMRPWYARRYWRKRNHRAGVAVLSVKVFVAGTLACFTTACVAGMLTAG